MKVGFNARYLYDPGLRGLNRYTFSLLRALENLGGVTISLFTEERFPVHNQYRRALRAEVTSLPASRTLLWEQLDLPRSLRRKAIDVFHAPADGGLPLRKPCPYVLTLHGVPDRSLGHQLQLGELSGSLGQYLDTGSKDGPVARVLQRLRSRALLNLYIRAADLVITVSEFSKEELVRYLGISPDKIRVTYEAPDERLVQPRSPEYIRGVRAKYGIPDCFVLFVGGYDKRKNVSALLRAFAALTTTHPDVGLVLVGIGGDIEDSRLQCRVLGMAEGRHVFFLERLSDPELGALYQAASLFATMSWHEGFCLPLAEAMACGAPVLASRFGAIPEILGGAGRLVDPRKVDEIADAMRTILREADLRSEMRARSLSRSSAFTWERTAEQTLEVYEELYRRCA